MEYIDGESRDIARGKICPVMSGAGKEVFCVEACAWYDEAMRECVVVSLLRMWGEVVEW